MKRLLYVSMIMVLAVTLLPMSVFAAAPAELDLKVRNQTGVEVEIRLTGADGVPMFVTLPAGTSTLTLTEGIYEYYVNLPCGVATGTWNVNVVKILYLSCSHDMANAMLVKSMKACEYWGSWDDDFQDYLDGDMGVIEPDFYLVYDSSGNGMHCLDSFMSDFMDLPGWQLRGNDGEVNLEDPNFFI